MKVFVLSTWFPYPPVNGSSLRTYHLLRAAAGRHDVDLAAFVPGDPPDDAALAHLRELCASVTVIPHSPFAPARKAGRWSTVPRSIAETEREDVRRLARGRTTRADLAVGVALSAARYLRDLPYPSLFEECEPTQIESQYLEAQSTTERLRRRLTWQKHAQYLQRLIDSVDRVTVVAPQEVDSLLRIGSEARKIALLPNGADDADLLRPHEPAMPPRLVYSGSVTYAPNLEAVRWFLAEVLPRIRSVRPDVQFWVTGSTGQVPVGDLPNSAWASFTGLLPDVKTAVGDASVAVVPLLTGGGSRLKVLEALALGTPVVSTRKGAEGLDLDDGREVLLADTPDAFAAHVLAVLDRPALAEALSAAGRARIAATYGWQAIGRRFLEVLDETVDAWRQHPRPTTW
jgi:glycosyltransferase involved in cell wall biosynthesis